MSIINKFHFVWLRFIAFFILTIFIDSSLIKAQNYDYLIVTPDIFLQNASWDNELILLQLSRGFHPVIASVHDQQTINSIQQDIINSYYYSNPIKYILLVGSAKDLISDEPPDTSFPDIYRDHGIIQNKVDYASGNYIPFNSVESSNPWNPPSRISYVATDDPYVNELTGHGEVYIGRVPVTSSIEATNYVNKLQSYYQSLSTYSEAFDNEILAYTDITHPNNNCTGELVTQLMETLKNQHISSYTSTIDLKVSEYNFGCDPFLYCFYREEVFEYYLNPGASIINIMSTGGGPDNLGGWYWHNSGFYFTNKNTAMPLLISPGCNYGEINNPGFECTMRNLMVYSNGGIIGAIAPTNTSEQHANSYVLNRFNDMIFQDEELTYGEIFKTIKSELANNYPLYEYHYNSLIYFGDPSLTPSIYKHRSGTITASTTWSGNFVIDNSVTIPQGYTLTILPGTNLFFKNGSSLIVEGGLNARGTSTKYITFDKDNSTGNWGNITFTTPARSVPNSSTLEYAKVMDATSVSCLNNAIVTIENSWIENCTNGIYIYNTEPRIINNLIKNSNGHGIYGEASGKSPLIQGNQILKTGSCTSYHSGEGIYLINITNPYIIENDIQGFNDGMYYGGGGVGYFTDYSYSTPERNNRLTDNYCGLNVRYGSYLFAGAYLHGDTPELIGNYNSIDNINYDAMAEHSATIIAEQNWWGEDGAQVYTLDHGIVDVSIMLKLESYT